MSKPKIRVLTASSIALINVAAICNIKNFPLLAEFGISILPVLFLASIIFFIPAAFVSAELASAWPDKGIYTWVRTALGPKLGFVAIWLQWIENVIYYPTILSFIASAIAYVFDPALASNKAFVITIIVSTFWLATILNFLGMKVSGLISTITAIFGTVVPVALLLILALFWILKGLPIQVHFSFDHFWPKLSSPSDFVLFSGVLFGLAGVEMSAVHAKDVQNPSSAYPRGIFLSALCILGFSTIGALSIATIVPSDEILLASGALEAFKALLGEFNALWAMPLVAFIVSFGALGMLSTWIVGPSRGLFATAVHGDLPPLFQKQNKKGMPVNILLAQAIIVTLLSFVFLFMPSINSSYWILLSLAALLYQMMYVLMFVSAIILRYKHPNVRREYKIPFGNVGMWIVGCLGLFGSILGFGISFLPPSQIHVGNLLLFEGFLGLLSIVFCAIPLVIYSSRKPSWELKSERS